jgi:hypothetical protein
MRNIHRLLVILSEITLKLDCKISIFFGNNKVNDLLFIYHLFIYHFFIYYLLFISFDS